MTRLGLALLLLLLLLAAPAAAQVSPGGGGAVLVGSSCITISSGTISIPATCNPTFAGMTISGTITGTPTWASTQTFPGVSTSGTLAITGIGKYLVGDNAAGVSTTYSINNVVEGANAKTVVANENILALASSEAAASFPLGLVIRTRGAAATANRQMHIQSTELGSTQNVLLLNPDGGNVGVGVAAGTAPSATLHVNGSLLVATKLTFTSFLIANIATAIPNNGDFGYCSDCTIANPCAGGGTGALAKRLNGANVCN